MAKKVSRCTKKKCNGKRAEEEEFEEEEGEYEEEEYHDGDDEGDEEGGGGGGGEEDDDDAEDDEEDDEEEDGDPEPRLKPKNDWVSWRVRQPFKKARTGIEKKMTLDERACLEHEAKLLEMAGGVRMQRMSKEVMKQCEGGNESVKRAMAESLMPAKRTKR